MTRRKRPRRYVLEQQRRQRCPRRDKVAHATRESAVEARDAALRKGLTLTVYACVCGAYHLGSGQSALTFKIRSALRDA